MGGPELTEMNLSKNHLISFPSSLSYACDPVLPFSVDALTISPIAQARDLGDVLHFCFYFFSLPLR